ncbi:PhzF family phenazine biosynthesis protein [uncultured Arsenicicoccus sp.]|uniref:PhzF family phenazine biosynthesis protein n=1 Tax=uncultured Arsenicicoccus sp. TaxID=491339 RepID=UPI002592E9BF|nr:PhzF family phenazine biosynthesis protein [uncultured Arsenicicoccus sp.]
MMRRFLEVDVFGSGRLTGNPLAVVADADGLTTEQMQRLAAWTNFSETTYLLPPTSSQADYRIRIFTPSQEYPFAGHPTIGSARAWLELGGTPRTPGRLVQECDAGLVPVRLEEDRLAFATPPRTRTGPLTDDEVATVATALAIDPTEIVAHAWGANGPQWRLVQLRDADAVRSLHPQADRGDLRIGVIGLEAPGGECAYEVRGFGPTYEDPVTGSLNGALAQWLREREEVPQSYVVAQGSQIGRRGRVHVHDDGQEIWIGGDTIVVVDGRLAM